jgi:hypothetical protein
MKQLIIDNPIETTRLADDIINLSNVLTWLIEQPTVKNHVVLKETTRSLLEALDLYAEILNLVIIQGELNNE